MYKNTIAGRRAVEAVYSNIFHRPKPVGANRRVGDSRVADVFAHPPHSLRPALWCFLGLAGAILTACGQDSSTGVASAPAELIALSPAVDTVVTGEESDPPVSVRVFNSLGEPVEGIPVRFILASGEGDLFPNLAVSNGDGVAEATFVGGIVPGDSRVRADIPSATNVASLQFEIVTQPAASVSLATTGGDGQLAEISSQLALPFEVQATTASGMPAGGIPIAWNLAGRAGGAILSADTTTTDSEGKAQVLMTLGSQAREYTVAAYAVLGVASDTVRFQATASATFDGRVRLDSIRPAPLVAGAEATLHGLGFLPDPAANEVRVEGIEAEVLSASALELRIAVPTFDGRCLPGRDVGVRILSGEDVSNGKMIRLHPAVQPLDLAPGEVRTLDGSEAVACFHFEAAAEPREYRIAVQSASQAAQASTGMRLYTQHGADDFARAVALTPPPLNADLLQAAQQSVRREVQLRAAAQEELLRRGLTSARAAGPDSAFQATRLPPAVGDTLEYFFSVDGELGASCDNTGNRIRGIVRGLRPDVVVVEDENAPAGGFSLEDWTALADEFQTVIFPTDTAYFGRPSDIDGNGRVVLLFTPEVNRLGSAGVDGKLGGFFLPLDLASASGQGAGLSGQAGEVCVASNEAEILYLGVADPEGEFGEPVSRDQARREARGRSAHELQHLIATERRLLQQGASADGMEEAWLAEGMAHLAEEVVGLRLEQLGVRGNLTYEQIGGSQEALDAFQAYHIDNYFHLGLFLANPTGVATLAESDPGGLEGLQVRGFAWFLLRWLGDQEGGGDERLLFRRLVDGGPNQLVGTENVESATGRRWADLLADFFATLPADDMELDALDSRHQVLTWNFRDVFAGLSQNPISGNRFVAPFPLAATDLQFETSAVEFDVRASTAKYFSLRAGASTPSLSFSVLGADGKLLSESAVPRVTVVRIR
jgi:hypothetical protein